MMTSFLEVSIGEAWDRYLILCIKLSRVHDDSADNGSTPRAIVLRQLLRVSGSLPGLPNDIALQVNSLYDIHVRLWDLENVVREHPGTLDNQTRLAVYLDNVSRIRELNSARAAMVAEINRLSGQECEPKQYAKEDKHGSQQS